MMGRQHLFQNKLFITAFNLDKRIRKDHPLRRIADHIDFDFIYNEVKGTYGTNGNVSVAPPVILKIMLLLILSNVRSERELMATIPERLDWLWFLGYDIDDEIPNHSVLSKARARWGAEVFKRFFERLVWQCVELGLVDGRKLFMDSSLVQANASNNSVVNRRSLRRYLKKSYQVFESRLEERSDCHEDDDQKRGDANRKHVSTTDPDASVTRKGKGKSRLKYQVHRAVDERCEVITATELTAGCVNEAHRLKSLIDSHHRNTGRKAEVCVADSKYGTMENYLTCYDLGVKSHFESFEKVHKGSGRQKGILPKEAFRYDSRSDTFICPAGEVLKRRRFSRQRQQFEYTASREICKRCHLRNECTRSQARTLKRHIRQDALDMKLRESESPEAKRDIKTRQHLMERSFARAVRYGFQRARWRRLWRVSIQEYLTAAIQNIMILIRYAPMPKDRLAERVRVTAKKPFGGVLQTVFSYAGF